MRILVFAIGMLCSFSVHPCITLPPDVARDHRSLIDEAHAILIVEVVGAGQGCALRVVHALKGHVSDIGSTICRLPGDGDWMTDFSGHTEASFWAGQGRLGVDGSCGVLSPAFSVGKSYLVLVGVAPDTKQYEQISGSEDRWLTFVEAYLGGE